MIIKIAGFFGLVIFGAENRSPECRRLGEAKY